MKTPNFLKAITLLAMMMVFAGFKASAANYYAYKGKLVTINSAAGFAEYKWIMVSQPNGTTNDQIVSDANSILTHTFTDPGAYKLRLLVKEATGCWSDVDPTKDIDIFVLPDFTVTVAADPTTPASYCTNADATLRTKLTATTAVITPGVTVPSEVTIATAPEWFKTPSTGSIASLTSISTANPYQVTETVADTYYFVATGKYVIPANRLISAVTPMLSAAFTVTVTAPPVAPTITPVVTN